MKKISLLLLAAAWILAGCNDAEKNSVNDARATVPDSLNQAVDNHAGCYRMIISKDTADLQLTDSAGGYHGILAYKRFEKDSNKGEVMLKKEGNELSGWYRFYSEGMLSVRQIIFKVTAGGLAEGYGDVGMPGDSVYYKYPSTLQFEEKHPFLKITCP